MAPLTVEIAIKEIPQCQKWDHKYAKYVPRDLSLPY